MIWLALAVTGMQAAAGAGSVALEAAFVAPPNAGAPGSVAVTFTPRDPDVRVNQEPPPRLKLDPAQGVLDYRPPARPASTPAPDFDPQTARYLEPAIPYAFPVSIKPGAAKGAHRVKGSVTYFYCSKSAGWCRKGSAEVNVPVTVR
jgi:hypothetical protein